MEENEESRPNDTITDESNAELAQLERTAARSLAAAIEAICMVSDQPVPPSLLADVLEISEAKADEACQQLAAEYSDEGRGFVLAKVAGGWRFQSHCAQAPYVERFVLDGQSARMSGAALETLAIIAYKQPMSRMQIAAIRGVNVDGVLKTLQSRGYVTETGHDTGPGQATLFGTTTFFLEKLGIASLAELPPLGDFIPGPDLVEVLEQGLRPSSAFELSDFDSDSRNDEAAEEEVSQENAQPSNDAEFEEVIIDLRSDANNHIDE